MAFGDSAGTIHLFHEATGAYRAIAAHACHVTALDFNADGSLGVLFDDGDNDPAVPRKDIRVIKLAAGMRIECLYGGGDTFFPG